MREEEQKAKWRAWGISILLHVAVFLLVAATGFFLLVRPTEKTVPEDTVWLEQPAGNAGSGSSGGKAPAAAAPAAMEVAMPPAADLPAITEDYTRHPEKKNDYRKQHQVAEDGTKHENQEMGSSPRGNSQTKGSSGNGSGNSSGSGAGNGNGDGAGAGTGSAGSGSGESKAPEPAKCLAKASPVYPASLRSQNAEGVVALLIYVQTGSVTNVVVTSSSGYGAMDQAAIAAGYRCQFRGSGVYPIRYRFQMTDGDDW